MKNDPTAAAERLSKTHGNYDEAIEDLWMVYRAYLAEHDPTPIDEAFVRSLGTPSRDDNICVVIPCGESAVFWNHGNLHSVPHCTLRIGAAWKNTWHRVATRGQLRRLAAALGLTLKETT